MSFGHFQRVGHALFVAEIRQADQHAVNFVGVPAEQLRAFAGVGVGLDAAELGILFAELNRLDAEFGEDFCDVRAGFGDELVGEKIAVAVNDAERRWLFV